MRYICIDGGTTNTRVRLVTDGAITDTEHSEIGSSQKDKTELTNACRAMIADILGRNDLTECDIEYIIASGMLTSELGLFCLPHALVPADVGTLAAAAKKVVLKDITSVPFVFTPGLKQPEAGGNMMRGEEAECFGLCNACNICGQAAVILPGTHNKVILYEDGTITDIYSMMSGELFAALSENTILRHSFPDGMPKGFDEEALLLGAEECRKYGLTEAALKIRSMEKGGGKTVLWLKSYLSGAVLYCDIQAMKVECGTRAILLGGPKALKKQLSVLIRRYMPDSPFTEAADEISETATTLGQMMIASVLK